MCAGRRGAQANNARLSTGERNGRAKLTEDDVRFIRASTASRIVLVENVRVSADLYLVHPDGQVGDPWRRTMTEYLLDRDPQTGIYETFEYDEDTGDITISRWADVQPVIDANKAAHLDSDGKGKDVWLAARIPVNIALDWSRFGINAWKGEHWPAVKKLLHDPDWRHLRPTTLGCREWLSTRTRPPDRRPGLAGPAGRPAGGAGGARHGHPVRGGGQPAAANHRRREGGFDLAVTDGPATRCCLNDCWAIRRVSWGGAYCSIWSRAAALWQYRRQIELLYAPRH